MQLTVVSWNFVESFARYCKKCVKCLFQPAWFAGAISWLALEDVVAQLCNPLTLQSEQSDRVGSIPSRPLPLGRYDKGSGTQLVLHYFWDPSAWHQKLQFHFTFMSPLLLAFLSPMKMVSTKTSH